MNRFIFLLGLLLAACRADVDQPVEPAATGPAAAVVAPPVQIVGQIVGEWRVAGVAGQPIDQPEGISATIAPDHVHVVAGCVNLRWGLVIAAGSARLNRVATESCARGLTPTEQALVSALTAADRAYRLPSNALIFNGPAGDVTLFTQ